MFEVEGFCLIVMSLLNKLENSEEMYTFQPNQENMLSAPLKRRKFIEQMVRINQQVLIPKQVHPH